MANRNNEPNLRGGFGGYPSAGLASYGQPSPRNYGSYAPQVGLAADLKKYQEEKRRQAREALRFSRTVTAEDEPEVSKPVKRRPALKESEPNVIDSEDDIRRLTGEGIIIGRRLRVKNSSDWKKFEARLQNQSRAYRTVPPNRLTMQYLTDAESDSILNQVIQKNRRRPQVASEEKAIIRDFREDLARSVGRLVSDDWQNELLACDMDPDQAQEIIEKISNPDRYASQHEGYERETDNFGIFNVATFAYKGLGSYGIVTKTISVQDSTKALSVGRQRIINNLRDEFHLDTTSLAEDWAGPQIPIWHMVGGYSLAGFRYQVPEIPSVDFTLDKPGVFQR